MSWLSSCTDVDDMTKLDATIPARLNDSTKIIGKRTPRLNGKKHAIIPIMSIVSKWSHPENGW
jgi:hypothetical protein